MLVDAHTHLNYEGFSEEERMERAKEIEESEVDFIVDVGDSVESSEQAVRDAAAYPWCFAAVGIHPDKALIYSNDDIDKIKELAGAPKVQAIGEIGLDFHYGKDSKAEQIELFRKQIRLANELMMPIMIHTREADALTRDILIEEGAFSETRKEHFPGRPDEKGNMIPDARVQLHCYSGSLELAREYVKLGATFSIGGPLTFKNARKTVEVLEGIPLQFIMSETDAPFLAPEPKRGSPNKTPYIEHVVRRMALLKGIDFDEAANITSENARRFFSIGDKR